MLDAGYMLTSHASSETEPLPTVRIVYSRPEACGNGIDVLAGTVPALAEAVGAA